MIGKTPEPIAEAYLKLVLALDQHEPGFLDAYFGPPELQAAAVSAGKLPLDELESQARAIQTELAKTNDLDAQYKDYFARQLDAIQAQIQLLRGETIEFAELVQRVFDVSATWTDESILLDIHRRLDALLPPGASLLQRMSDARRALDVPYDKVQGLVPEITAELRRRTAQLVSLPAHESFELLLVQDQPWRAYNWYQGGAHSRIDFNTDLPLQATELVGLMAHEGYPGHHTERSIKDVELYQKPGDVAFATNLLNAPEAVISEGIATWALDMVMTEQEQVDLYRREIFPRVGLGHLDAERYLEIAHVTEKLRAAAANAAILLHGQHAPRQQVADYIETYRLSSPDGVSKTLEFIGTPINGAYIFTYFSGWRLMDALFKQKSERAHWFVRLLREPVTPSLIRQWTNA